MADTVGLRVLHDGAKPIHDTGESYRFGLQRGPDDVQEGAALADGRLAFDIALRVKPGSDLDRPVFLGDFTFGPSHARFLHLGWKPDRPGWINRVKVPLSGINWAQVRAAQASGGRLTADATGRQPHRPRPLTWSLAEGSQRESQ
ncbi:MAG TPA: DUF5990 family protein [Caulobacteraceae bacterium]